MEGTRPISEILQEFFEDVGDMIFGNERREDISRVAEKHGFQYVKRMYVDDLDIELRGMKAFHKRQKRRRRIQNLLSKELPELKGRIGIFDYKIGNDHSSKRTSCILFNSEKLNLPYFRIRPKKSSERLGEFFIEPRLFLYYHPEFNKKYTVQGNDPEEVNEALSLELADLFLDERYIWIEAMGPYALIYRKNKLCSPEKLIPFVALGLEIAKLLIMEMED